MSEEGFVIINAILYIALFLLYWLKHKGLNIGTLTIGLWTLCAIVGVLYEPFNFHGHLGKITLWPYIYLFVCVLSMLIPILTFEPKKIESIRVKNNLLIPLGIVIGLIALPPFIESTVYYIHNRDNTQMMLEAFNERYEDATTTYNYLSTVSRRLTYILHSIRTLTLFMLAYMPTLNYRGKLFKLSYFGVSLATLMMFLEPMIILARFQVAIYAIYGLFIYLTIKNIYSDELKRKVRKVLISMAGAITLLLVAQTASRYFNFTENLGQQEVGTVVYLGQYLGESMGNFNGDIVHSEYRTNSDAILNTYENFLGIEQDKGYYAENRFNTNLFFTVVGEYWRTYGGYVTLILFIFVPFFFNLFVKSAKYKNISFAYLILFFMYSKMALVGIFYHAYFIDSNELLVMPIFMFILSRKRRIA